MKKIIFLLIVLLCTVTTFAQKEANIWYFGEFAGLDFNSGSPVALTNGALTTGEGCATICDKNGALLFYTDGIRVWDRTHTQMPNGFGLVGDPSSAESGVAIPKPGDKNRYYLFTVAAQGNAGGLRYSEIDMTLNGGLGDVVVATKNTLLYTPSVEKITATRHANGLYIWVISHGYNNNKYYAYLVDCNGVNAPITTDIGQVEGYPGWGYLKVSPDGKKLGTAMRTVGYELLDFNNATGVVSNPILLSNPGENYGAAFSPDSKLMYGLSINTGTIYQWNIQAGSAAAIISSVTVVGTAKGGGAPYRGGGMQLGPDKKLYITQHKQPYLSVINNPNVVGTGCNLQLDAIDLSGRNSVLGLPGFIQSFFDTPIVINHVNHCMGDSIKFSIAGNASYTDSVRWDFGDPATGALNKATTLTPAHIYNTPGSYAVRIIKYLPCVSDTTFATVVIDTLPKVNLGPDIAICAQTTILQPSQTYAGATYLWSTGDVANILTATQTNTYWLQVTKDGCIGADTIKVDLQGVIDVDLGPDKAICSPDTLFIDANQPPGTQYIWNTGLTSSRIGITQTGKYWVSVARNGCYGSDTINVTVVMPPVIDVGRDTIICEAIPVQIGAFVANAAYKWNNDSTTGYIYVAATGDYILTVTYGPCTVRDTVSITAMPAPVVDLGMDTDLCPKEIRILDAGNEGISYLWSDGTTQRTDTVKGIGTYWVKVSSEYHCISSDTIRFRPYPLPAVILGNDTTVCEETPFMLKPLYVIHEDEIRWSTGSAERQIDITEGGRYIVNVVNKCGAVSDTINIREIFCDIRIPNAFTPGSDGVNDILKVLGSIERLKDFQLSIYNRWGEQVFTTYDKYTGWDGTLKGTPCNTGVFVYVLQYSLDGNPVLLKGNVTLIR